MLISGDSVWSYDEINDRMQLVKIDTFFINQSSKLVYLRFGENEIWTTPEHPFLINSGIWEGAGSLNIGDTLWSSGGRERVVIGEVTVVDSITTVYNFHLDSIHTYWVGNQKIVVHNDQPFGGCRNTKHTSNRHVDRTKYPEKSKYKKPNQVEKLQKRTIKNPDQVTKQKDGRVRYDKEFGREIGTRGETGHRVIVDPKKKKITTSFPQK